jgi:hypothetical protein
VVITDHEKAQIERMVAAMTRGNDDALLAVFAQLYPHEWRRAAMIPGLRRLMAGWMQEPDPDPLRRLQRAAIILGHGREFTDAQWRAWALVSFALIWDDTIGLTA